MEGPRTMKMNVNKLANITGVWVTEADCKKLLSTYHEVHENLRPWWNSVEQELWRSHTVENMFGWVRIFYGHVRSILPEAVAHNPQSTVGQGLNMGVLNLHGKIVDYTRPHLTMPEAEIIELSEAVRHDWGFEMLQQVHDAVGFQYDLEFEDEIIWGVSKLMEIQLQNPRTLEPFIIPVEPAIGPSWGEVEEVEVKEIAWQHPGD